MQFGGGTGDIGPANRAEYILFFFCLMLGTVLWAIFVGTICGLISNADPNDIEYNQLLDSFNYFLRCLQTDCARTQCLSSAHLGSLSLPGRFLLRFGPDLTCAFIPSPPRLPPHVSPQLPSAAI